MNIPIGVTMRTEDVGATQRVTFYMNGEPMLAFRPGTRHEELAIEIALKEFNFFISRAFGEYLRSTNNQGLQILPTREELTDLDYF
jgi:hypothetical protein